MGLFGGKGSRNQRQVRKSPERNESLSMGRALSVNGELVSLMDPVGGGSNRSQEYTSLALGKPLVVRYLSFFLVDGSARDRNNHDIMISTFTKTEEVKEGAAEAVNYYNTDHSFSNGLAEVRNWGGRNYGHELIHYSKSYAGESLRLTSMVRRLRSPGDAVKKVLDGIGKVGGSPFFIEFLPYAAVGKAAGNVVANLLNVLIEDRLPVPATDLDLHFGRPNSNNLQSGRIVCVQGMNDADLVDSGMRLNEYNYLVDSSGKQFDENSYYVMQVNSEKHKSYEDFDYVKGAAELLALTDQKGGLDEFIEVAVQGFSAYADIRAIDEIEEMRRDLDEDETFAKAEALFKGLDPDLADYYETRWKGLKESAGR